MANVQSGMSRKSSGQLSAMAAPDAASPPPNFPADSDEYEHPDIPRWRKEYSYRGGPYRYLNHQKGIIGYIKVRLVAARDLGKTSVTSHKPQAQLQQQARDISPQVQVQFMNTVQRSSTVAHNSEPTWRKEEFIFEFPKGSPQEGLPVFVYLDVLDMNTTGSALKLRSSKPASLGLGSLDITPMLMGEDGNVVIDTWVDLSTSGKVHLIVEYEPYGQDPEPGDIVFLEAFARNPSSLVLPANEPMVVREASGPYLLASFLTPTAVDRADAKPGGATSSHMEGRVKLHRNTVFVIERKTFIDGVWHRAMAPTDLILATGPGSWLRRNTRPYLSYVRVLATPVVVSVQVAVGAARIAVRSALAGMSEATNTALGNREHRF